MNKNIFNIDYKPAQLKIKFSLNTKWTERVIWGCCDVYVYNKLTGRNSVCVCISACYLASQHIIRSKEPNKEYKANKNVIHISVW